MNDKYIKLIGITINNFKSINTLEIDLRANKNNLDKELFRGEFVLTNDSKYGLPFASYVLGRNSIGKTTVLEAISFVGDVANHEYETMIINDIVYEEYRKSGVKDTNYISDIEKKLNDEINERKGLLYDRFNSSIDEFYREFHRLNSKDDDKDIRIQLIYDNSNNATVTLIIRKDGYMMCEVQSDDSIRNVIIDSLNAIKSDVGNIVMNGRTLTKSRQTRVFDPLIISKSLVVLHDKLGTDQLGDLVRLSDPNIAKFIIEDEGEAKATIRYFITNKGNVRMIDSLSAGTKHFVYLSSFLLSNAPNGKSASLVLIDELDLSLHSELVYSLQVLMDKISLLHGTQFILTTHSPLTLEGVSNKRVFTLVKNDDNITYKKLSQLIKPHQSKVNAYKNGFLANYPDPVYSKNVITELEF